MRRRRWSVRAAAAVAVTALTLAGCSSAAEDTGSGTSGDEKAPASGSPSGETRADAGGLPGVPSARQAREALGKLTVRPHGSMDGYSREKFPHWSSQGERCDTREKVLQRAGRDVKQNDECRAVSGRWTSVYDDKTFTDASDLDIDHMVPLANAWRSGAREWDQERREGFANDLTRPQLLAVSATTNRTKGDQGPEDWQPPAKGYRCTYARAWTGVKSHYRLSVTSAEKTTLARMLESCS
ncbi:HNH endonuclease family protein [Streptomyces cacaoi]|uniref:HNH endonuclease family protein n=1 Tax=Streptomyces cacaoi TaxID=1898 RepID=UPI0033219392